MSDETSACYEFGRFRLKAEERVLRRGDELVALTPKAFDILLMLLENAGRIVNKEDLMKKVWPKTFVEEGNLTQNISLLRKALGESAIGPQFIETVPRRGYRFVAPVNTGNGNGRETALESGVEAPPISQVLSSEVVPRSNSAVASERGTWDIRHWTFLSGRAPAIALTLAAVLATIFGIAYFSGRDKAGATTSAIQSIAVLPFVDEGPNEGAEFLDDEIAESLVNSLTKLPKLRVVPRSVMVSYKGRNVDPRKVGEELNVRAVVTGRIRRHGDTISIQADLIDLDSVSQIWGQHYDRRLADILLVQEEISRDIFENLRLKLNVEEQKQLEAYRLYLKGRNAWNKRTREGMEQGIDYFQQAIAADPNYAAAYAGLADCYNMQVIYGVHAPKEGFPKAKEAAVKALEMDETLAEAHTSLAFIKFRWDRDRVEAEREFRLAIQHKPTYAPAHQWYSSYLVALERFDEAIAEAKRTSELEPLSFTASSHLGWILYLSGRNDEAIAQCAHILSLEPNSFPARRYLGLAYEQKGMYAQAIDEFQKGLKVSGSPLMLALLGHAYAASGKTKEAQQVISDLHDLSESREAKRYVSPYTVAAIYAALNEKDQAFKWLEQAYEERDVWLMNLKVDPVFAKLRSDKRFQDLLTRAGLRP
ncbi:MAG TPA: winged helix-turn-helix domain-containing protein [Pyrinomonadaceae bacterium]|jgi:DNA-binding winged helix-turn-helix (wHTH) protein/TolB-like protein/Tfp pilus assembly protein PilF